MKRFTYILSLAVLLLCAETSCKKSFLSIVPIGQQVAKTTADYGLLMNSSSLYYYSFAGGWQAPGVMGDDVAAEASYYNSAQLRSKQAFTWADDLYQTGDYTWDLQNWLTNLYTVNKVINEVMASTGGTDQQKKAVQAEAYAYRAWLYFQFVNFYGKPYKAATAAADLAFPIIKTSDVTVKNFTRATVQENYDFIISDFTAAIASLPAVNPGGATRFSRAGAEGLLGKVYLFMGNNTGALAMFNSAFADNATATTPARLYDYNKEFVTGGKFFPVTSNGPTNSPEITYQDVTESIMAISYYNGVYSGNGFGADFIVLSQQAVNLFQPSDFRLNFYTAHFPFNTVNPSGRLSKYNSYSGPYPKYGLQISELYLLRAEVKTRLNDLTGAVTDVETLRKNRMPAVNYPVPATSSASQAALLQFIFDEREREFATQGYRWFDMRRLSVDPILTSPITYTHTLYKDATSTNTTVYTLNPVRLTMRLPLYIMVANPQFTDNP